MLVSFSAIYFEKESFTIMRKTSSKSYCEYSRRKVVKKYIKIVENIEEIIKRRNSVLERHFKLLLEPAAANKNIETQLSTALEKPQQLPPIFLASSIGFTKHAWNKNTEALMAEFDLKKKPQFPVLRNALLFEKLKLLAIKLQSKERKKK